MSEERIHFVAIPQAGIRVCSFTIQCAEILGRKNIEIFWKSNERKIVEIIKIQDGMKNKKFEYMGFEEIKAARLINIIEANIATTDSKGRFKSITTSVAQISLQNDAWKNNLQHINRIFTVPIPILYENKLCFPKKGHDERFNSWLVKNAPEINESLTLDEAKKTIENIYSEFCFTKPQDKVNAIAHLLTEFCQGLYTNFNTRTPIFFYEANRERAGKDYCALIPSLVFEGMSTQDPPISTDVKKGKETEELRKKITTMLKNGRRRYHSSNNRGHISNEMLESLATSEFWADRVLGGNTEIKLPNELFISLSANTGFTSTPDFINRCVFIRMLLEIEDANKRQFKNPKLHEWILKNRNLIISALFCFVKNWFEKGMPKGITPFSSFPEWAEIVGGIMMCNDLGDCCLDNRAEIDADPETEGMKTLFLECHKKDPKKMWSLGGIIDFILEEELDIFDNYYFRKDDGSINNRAKLKFGRLIRKYNHREFGENSIKLIIWGLGGNRSRLKFQFKCNGCNVCNKCNVVATPLLHFNNITHGTSKNVTFVTNVTTSKEKKGYNSPNTFSKEKKGYNAPNTINTGKTLNPSYMHRKNLAYVLETGVLPVTPAQNIQKGKQVDKFKLPEDEFDE